MRYHDHDEEGDLDEVIARELDGLTDSQRVDLGAMCFESSRRR